MIKKIGLVATCIVASAAISAVSIWMFERKLRRVANREMIKAIFGDIETLEKRVKLAKQNQQPQTTIRKTDDISSREMK